MPVNDCTICGSKFGEGRGGQPAVSGAEPQREIGSDR